MKNNRWKGALAALMLVAAACGGANSDSSAGEDADSAVGADEPTETTTAEAATATTASDDSEETTETGPAETDEGEPLEIGGPVGPGIYSTDLLGTSVTFDFDGTWIAAAGDPGAMVFVDPETERETSEVILVTRMNSLAGPEDTTVEPVGPTMSGPADDLQAWIDAVGELVADGPYNTDVSGNTTTRFDFTVDPEGTETIPGGCGPGPDDRCFFVGGTSSKTVAFFIVRTTEVYRMWMIDQGEEDPILITAIASGESPEWLDNKAEAFLDSMTLGETAPHPVVIPDGPLWEAGWSSDVPAGVQTFPALGGITMELPYDTYVWQDGNCLSVQAEVESHGELHPSVLIALASLTGVNTKTPITTVDEVIALGSDRLTFTENGESITVLGVELIGYDVRDNSKEDGPPAPENMFSCAPVGDAGSNAEAFPGPVGTTYMAPYEGGVLVISAEAWDEVEMEDSLALLDALAPTLVLAE